MCQVLESQYLTINNILTLEETKLFHVHLHREFLSQGEQERMQVDIRVFAEAICLSMMLAVQVIPPAA